MPNVKTQMNCPHCGEAIDVNTILHQQIHQQLDQEYHAKLKQEKQKYAQEAAKLNNEREKLEQEKQQQQITVAEQVKAAVQQQESRLQQKYKTEAAAEQATAIKALNQELQEKSAKIQNLNQVTIALERLKREKDELETTLKAAAAQELRNQLQIEAEKIYKEANQKNELQLKELEKQLEDQKKLTEEMQRKHAQRSIQMQGEVQELSIEAWLSQHFPLDNIAEIKKGERGADCLQIVHTRTQQHCGTIYYESKRTKAFGATWIEKFKADIREKNADIGVLVTETMPNDMERFGLKDGIWICSFEEFKGLCTVLRESIIQLSNSMATQENKGDKMGLLYDYLSSNEFRLQIEAIVEGFTQMKTDLAAEQRAMRSIWKKREKQIEKVLTSTAEMHGSIKGIAGNAIQSVALLELPSEQPLKLS